MTFNVTIDPDAELDYEFDWTPWLAASETITGHTIVASAGITAYNDAVAGGLVTVWAKDAAPKTTQRITCRIVTNQGRTDDRTIRFTVTDR